MPTKEMLILLNTLDAIKRNGHLFQSQASNMGYLTYEEVETFQKIASRPGGLGKIVASVLGILEKTEDHPDLPSELSDLAGMLLSWSLQLSKPLEVGQFSAGDKVRVRFPGKGLVYLGTVIEGEGDELCVALPMLNSVVPLNDVHVQEKIAKPKPQAGEVAEFQRMLHNKLEEILNTVSV